MQCINKWITITNVYAKKQDKNWLFITYSLVIRFLMLLKSLCILFTAV